MATPKEDPFGNRYWETGKEPEQISYILEPGDEGQPVLTLVLWDLKFWNLEGEYLDNLVEHMRGLIQDYDRMQEERDLRERNDV